MGLLVLASFILTACGTSEVTASSSDLWERFVYLFAVTIRFLSFNGSTGIGIILFTLIIRTVLLPVFQLQINASRKMQEAQPLVKELQAKYPGRDMESRNRLAQETQKLYRELGVKPSASFWPLLIQMPVLIALYHALIRVEFLKVGHFLWMNLGATDPYYILPVLAAAFTFLSTWLSNKGMMFIMPVFVFFFAVNVASGVALYWSTSYAYQVFQTLLLSNPYKIIAEREAKAMLEREREEKKKRAYRKAQKKKK